MRCAPLGGHGKPARGRYPPGVASHPFRGSTASGPAQAVPPGRDRARPVLAIGTRALQVAANQSVDEDEQLTKRQIGVYLALALVLFIGVFMVGPTTLFSWVQTRLGGGVSIAHARGLFRRSPLFVGYLWLIGRSRDIHRVFEYHGAEHKTIAAATRRQLGPGNVDRYSKEHRSVRHELPDHRHDHHDLRLHPVRLARLLWRTSTASWRSRSSPACLRGPAAGRTVPHCRSRCAAVLMAPGDLWLQRITTQEPDVSQIEVAIASFGEVLRREDEAADAAG